MSEICNMDCFNCIHPDCINNSRMTREENAMIKPFLKKQKTTIAREQRERVHDYYHAHKENINGARRDKYVRSQELVKHERWKAFTRAVEMHEELEEWEKIFTTH